MSQMKLRNTNNLAKVLPSLSRKRSANNLILLQSEATTMDPYLGMMRSIDHTPKSKVYANANTGTIISGVSGD